MPKLILELNVKLDFDKGPDELREVGTYLIRSPFKAPTDKGIQAALEVGLGQLAAKTIKVLTTDMKKDVSVEELMKQVAEMKKPPVVEVKKPVEELPSVEDTGDSVAFR